MINDARAIPLGSPAFHIRKVKWKSRGKYVAFLGESWARGDAEDK